MHCLFRIVLLSVFAALSVTSKVPSALAQPIFPILPPTFTINPAPPFRFNPIEKIIFEAENPRLCRAAAYQAAIVRTVAPYWVAVGVDSALIQAVLDTHADIEDDACEGTMTTSDKDEYFATLDTQIQHVIDAFGAASKLPKARWSEVFWRSSEAEMGRLTRLCVGGANPQAVLDFVGGKSSGSIDIAGRPSGYGYGQISPITPPGSSWSTGPTIPCVGPGSGGGGAGGGSSANSSYTAWIWGQSWSGSSAPSCFDASTSGNTCSPWARPSGEPPSAGNEGPAKSKEEIAKEIALAKVGLATVVAGVALHACTTPTACLGALAVAAITYVVLVKEYEEKKAQPANAPGQYCPVLGGRPVATLRSPSGVGPLGEYDALEMCGKKCDINRGDCTGINSKIGCNYNPIATTGYPSDICVSEIANDNPWLTSAKIAAEVCGRMRCPNNARGGQMPGGQCTCGAAGVGLGGPAINWSCSRIMCSPTGDNCSWGC